MLDEIGTDNFRIHDNYIEIMEIINFKVDYELNHIKKEVFNKIICARD